MFNYAIVIFCAVFTSAKPIYNYRYETEDLMEAAASAVPLQGYHVVERSYYPGPQFATSFGGPHHFVGGYNFGHGFGPGVGHGFGGIHGNGGEYVDKSSYEGGNKNFNDGRFDKAIGSSGSGYNYGREGFNHGNLGEKDAKEDSGYYNSHDGGKKSYEDGKSYHGAQRFNHEGKNAGENKELAGHKKGHKVNGFKKSHQQNESGKTEEYYDEANDEGKHYQYKGEAGGFGKNAESAYKGGQQDKQFDAKENKQEGHFVNSHSVDGAKSQQGHYAEKKHLDDNKTYGFNNGIDEQSLLGHEESTRTFKKYPFHTPFFH